MDGQNQQPWVFGGGEASEDKVLRLLAGPGGGRCLPLVAIGQGRLVAVVAVGDVQGGGSELLLQPSLHSLFAEGPEGVRSLGVLGDRQGASAAYGVLQGAVDDPLRIAVEDEDGAEAGATGP